jgi:hypothetical protein
MGELLGYRPDEDVDLKQRVAKTPDDLPGALGRSLLAVP